MALERIRSDQKKKLLLSGGGTAGHLFAAFAIADAWKKQFGKNASVFFVGSFYGLEKKFFPKRTEPHVLLAIQGIKRKGWLQKIKSFSLLPWALIQSAWVLWRFHPTHILGVGSYASGPVVWLASVFKKCFFWNVKIAILEQNTFPGWTNRFLSQWVDQIFVAFPSVQKWFPKKKAIYAVGNPLRPEFYAFRKKYVQNLKTDFRPDPKQEPRPVLKTHVLTQKNSSLDPSMILIVGGSQGAVGMNRLVLKAFELIEEPLKKVWVVHQSGKKDFDFVKNAYQKFHFSAQVEPFFDPIWPLYQKATFVIARAGASTLFELAALGKAAILVPLPTAAQNHQEQNAKWFAEAGGLWFVKQDQKNAVEDLAKKINLLLSQKMIKTRMEQQMAQIGAKDAATEILKWFI